MKTALIVFGTIIIIAALPSIAPVPVGALLPNGPSSTLTSTLFLPLIYGAPPPAPLTPTQFGFAFISSAEAGPVETRYQRAAAVRATLNRWPFYWSRIETDAVNRPGLFKAVCKYNVHRRSTYPHPWPLSLKRRGEANCKGVGYRRASSL
jgi:hypothetical protein